jgi:crotonobetainyl-CoA:carnitine CoA-transferase CaiB-like acyl-CoA transferase
MIVEVEHPVAGKFKMPGCPLKLSATPAEEFSPAPVLGADLESVLVEYAGMTPEEIEDLRKRGIA